MDRELRALMTTVTTTSALMDITVQEMTLAKSVQRVKKRACGHFSAATNASKQDGLRTKSFIIQGVQRICASYVIGVSAERWL